MKKHHANGMAECPLCEEKLLEAHPELVKWFRTVKARHKDCHIAWSYRGKDAQEAAFLDGKTKLHFPNSPHNKTDAAGKPCSLALDLFELDYNNHARWSWDYFRLIADDAAKTHAPIFWGGNWHGMSDFDHFELRKTHDS